METLVIPAQHGAGFHDVITKIKGFVKKHKLVSRGLRIVPHRLAHAVAAGAEQLGYGTELVIPPQHGGGFFDVIKKIGSFITDNGLISKGLSLIPGPIGSIGSKVAGMAGFGRGKGPAAVPRRRTTTVKQAGGARKQSGGRKMIKL